MKNVLSLFTFLLRGEIIKYVPKSFKLNWTWIYLASSCPLRWSYYCAPCIPICISRFHICLIAQQQQQDPSRFYRNDTIHDTGKVFKTRYWTRCVNDNPSDSIATLRIYKKAKGNSRFHKGVIPCSTSH